MNSPRILILAEEDEPIRSLADVLIRQGYDCSVVSSEEELADDGSSDLCIIDAENGLSDAALEETIRKIKQDRNTYIVLLADKDALPDIENDTNIDDFVLKPYDADEISARIKRLLQKRRPKETSAEYLKAGDIIIDLPKCEVRVRGKVVDLTFTEYELLKALMSKQGHVITREALLNKIWGYDYYGGDRTVDVHITRLRSKIEDPSHNFIETVRNMGYRIKENNK